MRFIPLTQDKLIDLRVFLHKVKGDVLPTKKRAKTAALEDYVMRGRYRMMLAMQEDMVAGYIAYDTQYKKDAGRIIGMAVLRELRGKGVGTELLRRAIFDFRSRNVKSIQARTWETNIASIKMLERAGFKRMKTIKDDRENGEATLWFKYKVPPQTSNSAPTTE